MHSKLRLLGIKFELAPYRYNFILLDKLERLVIISAPQPHFTIPSSITNIQNGTSGKEPYMHGAKLHLFAFTKYIYYIKNKKVAVIGSQTPWIESVLLHCGAKEIITVEYNVPVCNHDIIKTISYADFCNSSEK